MNIFKIGKNFIFDPIKRGGYLCAAVRKIGLISDKTLDEKYIRVMYQLRTGKKLDLDSPKTYNEKLQWMKLYYHNPLLTKLVDKYEVKEYVADVIGSEYIIPTIGLYHSFDEIDFSSLPEQFVIKCTHDSGGLVICKDKNKLNYEEAKRKIEKSLAVNYYYAGREWPYKNVPPRIIIEEYMEDKKTAELRDYKFFVFNGEVKALFVASERQKAGEETKFDFFDENYNHLDVRHGHPNADVVPEKPLQFDKMIELSEKLGKGMPHVRVDFYSVNGKIYFGELTFFHHGGWMPFDPDEWDTTFGSWIRLPEKMLGSESI